VRRLKPSARSASSTMLRELSLSLQCRIEHLAF
jgi:hypothetical protein